MHCPSSRTRRTQKISARPGQVHNNDITIVNNYVASVHSGTPGHSKAGNGRTAWPAGDWSRRPQVQVHMYILINKLILYANLDLMRGTPHWLAQSASLLSSSVLSVSIN